MIKSVRIGLPDDDPQPFMGPVISAQAAEMLLNARAELIRSGGVALAEMNRSPRHPALISPGLIDVTDVRNRPDVEHFGPLLQVIRVDDFDAAIHEANNTSYGLSAGLICDKPELYQKVQAQIRAGVLAWNRPLTRRQQPSSIWRDREFGQPSPRRLFRRGLCRLRSGFA